MTIKATAAVLDMDAILDTADIFAMAAILAMATALDTEAIIAMATILAIKYKLLKYTYKNPVTKEDMIREYIYWPIYLKYKTGVQE